MCIFFVVLCHLEATGSAVGREAEWFTGIFKYTQFLNCEIAESINDC